MFHFENQIRMANSIIFPLLGDGQSFLLGQSNLNELHWTPFQQLTHLASAGEGLATGDLFGTGTISSDVSLHITLPFGFLFLGSKQRTHGMNELCLLLTGGTNHRGPTGMVIRSASAAFWKGG